MISYLSAFSITILLLQLISVRSLGPSVFSGGEVRTFLLRFGNRFLDPPSCSNKAFQSRRLCLCGSHNHEHSEAEERRYSIEVGSTKLWIKAVKRMPRSVGESEEARTDLAVERRRKRNEEEDVDEDTSSDHSAEDANDAKDPVVGDVALDASSS